MSKCKEAFISGAQKMLDRLDADPEFSAAFTDVEAVRDVLTTIVNVGDDKLTDIVTVRSLKGLSKDLDFSDIGGRNNPLRGLKNLNKAFVAVFDCSVKAPGALGFLGAAETDEATMFTGRVSIPKQPDQVQQQLRDRFAENNLDVKDLKGNDLRALDFIDDMGVEMWNSIARHNMGGGMGMHFNA